MTLLKQNTQNMKITFKKNVNGSMSLFFYS